MRSYTPYKVYNYGDNLTRHYYTAAERAIVKKIRDEAAEDGKIIPPLPCLVQDCPDCIAYKNWWDEAIKEASPHTLTLELK